MSGNLRLQELSLRLETMINQAHELERSSPMPTCETTLLALYSLKAERRYPQLLWWQRYRHQAAIIHMLGLVRRLKQDQLDRYRVTSQVLIVRNSAIMHGMRLTVAEILEGMYVGTRDYPTILNEIAWLQQDSENIAAHEQALLQELADLEAQGAAAEAEFALRWESGEGSASRR